MAPIRFRASYATVSFSVFCAASGSAFNASANTASHVSYSNSEIRHISVDTLSMPFPKENSMTTASRQCRESSTATGYSPLRTPLTKSIPVIMKSGSSCVSRRKNLFWRLSGRGSISRSQSGTPGWIKRLIMFSTGVIRQRPIWKTDAAALPTILV